ncbi:MAG TPA: oligosaccharide flippase family protein [Candidatus Limnocylindria bacterium]|jgi:O-antigen/teichoic acid export membrane protein|nr:oligosaccharide flippase family protein [Candidatus Limnocylindria bacterium]
MTYTRGALVSLIARAVAIGLGTLTAIALARWLGPADRGAYGVVTSVAALVTMVANLGLGDAQTHFVGRDPSRLPRAFGNALLFSTLAGILAGSFLFVLRIPLAQAMPTFADDRVLAIVIVTLPALLLYGFVHPLLQAVRRFALSAALVAFSYALLLATIWILVVSLGLGLIGALVGWCVAHVLLVIVAIVPLARRGPVVTLPRLAELRAELRLGTDTWLNSTAALFVSRVGLLVAGALIAPVDTGRYAVALTLVELLWYGADSASVALKPLLARVAGSGEVPPTAEVTRTVVALTAIGAAVMFVAAEPILALLFGVEYAPGATAVRWLLPGIVGFSVWRVLFADLIGRGAPGRAIASALAAAAVATAGCLALIPSAGAVGAAGATSAAYLIATTMLVRTYGRLTGTSAADLIVPRGDDIGRLWSRVRA